MTKDEQAILNNLYDAVYYLSRCISTVDGVPQVYLDHAMHRIAAVKTALDEVNDGKTNS